MSRCAHGKFTKPFDGIQCECAEQRHSAAGLAQGRLLRESLIENRLNFQNSFKHNRLSTVKHFCLVITSTVQIHEIVFQNCHRIVFACFSRVIFDVCYTLKSAHSGEANSLLSFVEPDGRLMGGLLQVTREVRLSSVLGTNTPRRHPEST